MVDVSRINDSNEILQVRKDIRMDKSEGKLWNLTDKIPRG